jgi:UDP-N-acetylmuramate dehydrogenase
MTFDTDTVYTRLHPYFQERIRRHEALAHHSASGIGGEADLWIGLETTQELIDLVRFCAEEHVPLLITGNSTNILFSDKGVRGIVARMGAHAYQIEEQGPDRALLIADAGVSWSQIIQELATLGWKGLEFGIGIPGTLAGGIVSNAGAHNEEIGQHLQWLEVLDARGSNIEGEDQVGMPLMRRYEHSDLDLGYRYSRFREQRQVHVAPGGQLLPPQRSMIEPAELIVRLALMLERDDPARIQARLNEYQARRRKMEPVVHHAGPIFKDVSGEDIHALITQAGLQGYTQGKAQISPHNANYIVNLGGASAREVATLIALIHQQVRSRLGINLAIDLELQGEWESTLSPLSQA